MKKIAVAVIIASFLLSLAYSFFYRIEPVVDARAYDQIAQNILAGHGFVEDAAKPILYDHAIVRAGPAYEYFLAGVYAVFGHHYEAVWVLQALLHALTALLILLIARKLFSEDGEVIGLIAAALIGFHPDLIEISAMLMTETLYLFLVVAVLWLFVELYSAQRYFTWSAALGALTGLAILARPPVLLFIPVFVVFYFRKSAWIPAAIFTVALCAVMAPWVARNERVYHQFIPTTMIGEYNLWVGNTLQSNGGQISGGYNPAIAYAEANGYADYRVAARNYFKSFMLARPMIFAQLVGRRVIKYASLIRPMGFWFYQTGAKQMLFVASSGFAIALLFLSGLAGMLFALKQRNALLNYVAVLALTAPIALMPAVVESRYRFQIYPFLALFGAYAIYAVATRLGAIKSRTFGDDCSAENALLQRCGIKKSVWIASGTLLILTGVDVLYSAQKVIERLQSFL